MKRKGTHSTQRKYFGSIPRSEFYGFVLGYALGLFVTGFLRLQSQYQEILFALCGLGIGYYIDMKYYRVPNEPEEASPEELPDTAAPGEPECYVQDGVEEIVRENPKADLPDEPEI